MAARQALSHWSNLRLVKDIRPDLRERLDSITKEIAVLRAKVTQNENEESLLKILLQREDARFGKLEASLPIMPPSNGAHVVQSSTGGTPLARLIVNTMRNANKVTTLADLKKAAEAVGYDFGAKAPGRVLHWALVAMSENGSIVRKGDGWNLKEMAIETGRI